MWIYPSAACINMRNPPLLKSCCSACQWTVGILQCMTWCGAMKCRRRLLRHFPMKRLPSGHIMRRLNGCVCQIILKNGWSRRAGAARWCGRLTLGCRFHWKAWVRRLGWKSRSWPRAKTWSAISAFPASPPRRTAEGHATCRSMTERNGSVSKHTTSVMWRRKCRYSSGFQSSPYQISCGRNIASTRRSMIGASAWTWRWCVGQSPWTGAPRRSCRRQWKNWQNWRTPIPYSRWSSGFWRMGWRRIRWIRRRWRNCWRMRQSR